MAKEKISIGWREYVALPELDVKSIKVKVDSGARTSGLHAEDIKIYTRAGQRFAKFTIYPEQNKKKKKIVARAKLIEKRIVRSSVGTETKRPVIQTNITIGDNTFPIELTLVNRDVMGFRMLLGRQALRGRYVIDPGQSYVTSKNIRTSKFKSKTKPKSK